MAREGKGVCLGDYGFDLTLHVVRDRPWPENALALARKHLETGSKASDLEAIASLLVGYCAKIVSQIAGEAVEVITRDPDRAERN